MGSRRCSTLHRDFFSTVSSVIKKKKKERAIMQREVCERTRVRRCYVFPHPRARVKIVPRGDLDRACETIALRSTPGYSRGLSRYSFSRYPDAISTSPTIPPRTCREIYPHRERSPGERNFLLFRTLANCTRASRRPGGGEWGGQVNRGQVLPARVNCTRVAGRRVSIGAYVQK